ncbi:hypothetical protein [Streptomyces sp. WZ-12]|uniref:hypothetical protein n=1 Tax=Streptomyces sp. WZ-12 TaxID=3030210 RepID=UPI0023812637|nr:hypothetical protein [Streptomyces sp. WZ-12]
MGDHFHIGFNTVGFEPNPEDVQCLDDDVLAVSAFEDLLTDYIDESAEQCAHFGNDSEWVGCSCAWCALVLQVERYRDDIGDDSIWHRLLENGRDGEVFGPPGLQKIAFWVKRMDGACCAA